MRKSKLNTLVWQNKGFCADSILLDACFLEHWPIPVSGAALYSPRHLHESTGFNVANFSDGSRLQTWSLEPGSAEVSPPSALTMCVLR